MARTRAAKGSPGGRTTSGPEGGGAAATPAERALRLFAHLVSSTLPGAQVRVESSTAERARGTVSGSHAGYGYEAAFDVEARAGGVGGATYRVPHVRVTSVRRLPFEDEPFRAEAVGAFKGDNTHASLGDFGIDRVFIHWEDALPVVDAGLMQRLRAGLEALDDVARRHTPRLSRDRPAALRF